jgi:amino acid transporter
LLTLLAEEASGAPVEVHSSLGYSVNSVAILFLNFSMMVGTGVYSTPSTILRGTGSPGLALIFWTIGFFISIASLAIYLEFASYFPNRSGSEVVYLEQAYPRPKYFFPLTFAVQTVALSFSASNAIVLAEYLYKANGHSPSSWELKGVAIAGYSIAYLLVVFHTRGSIWISNGIGAVKLTTLVFISITGLVVLGGHTRVKDPRANFKDAFKGSGSGGGYGATTALYDIIFSYAGYTNAFNVVNEVRKPVQSLKKNATLSLLVVAILYILANVTYLAAVPKAALAAGKQTVASLFFEAVFGSNVKGLNVLIAISAFGNIISVLIGQSRLIRECGRYVS